jgi:ribosomal protein L25 (general stress protein Ctc)
MNKKISNNEGSALVLLVIAIAIISLLGTSVLGVTMLNLKVKKTNTEIKESFYLSESGLDKAYDATYKLVIDAINISNNNAQLFLQQFTVEKLNDLIEKSKNNEYDDDLIFVIDADGDGIKDSYDEGKIKDRAESIFTNYFYKYVTKSNYGENHRNIIKLLKEINTNPKITINNIKFNEINLSVNSNDDLSNDGGLIINEGDVLKIDIESLSDNDGIKQTTSIVLSIEIPKYNVPYTISSSIFSSDTLFSNKVLTAKEKGKDVNVTYSPEDSFYFSSSVNVNVDKNEFINIIDGEKKNINAQIPIDDNKHTVILITDKNVVLDVHKIDLSLTGLIITSGEIFIKTTDASVDFKGVMVSGAAFTSKTGKGNPVELHYDGNVVWSLIDEAIEDGNATDELKDTVNNIYSQIYNKSTEKNKITIKNSAEIIDDSDISNLIKFSNWRNK